MGPRANFACLATRCQQDGAASIYELPITATRCPVCGSKRIRRLYDSINISSGLAKRTDALVGPTLETAIDREAESRRAAIRAEVQNGPVRAVPFGQVGARLKELGLPAMSIGAPSGKSVALTRAPSEDFAPFQRQAPRPQVIARDTEYTIKRKPDGTPVAAKA